MEFRMASLTVVSLCAFFSIATYVCEQPFYAGKSPKDWSGFQDYKSIYPTVANTI